jgi:hypothetical protein
VYCYASEENVDMILLSVGLLVLIVARKNLLEWS